MSIGQKSLRFMPAGPAAKRVLVLSDNEKLSKAVELNLSNPTPMEVVHLAPTTPEHHVVRRAGDFDLLVVATSSPASEPLVMLAQASLADWVGRVPVLIISDRPFSTDPDAKIAHLGFPFRPEGLCYSVMGLLHEGCPASRNGDACRACGLHDPGQAKQAGNQLLPSVLGNERVT